MEKGLWSGSQEKELGPILELRAVLLRLASLWMRWTARRGSYCTTLRAGTSSKMTLDFHILIASKYQKITQIVNERHHPGHSVRYLFIWVKPSEQYTPAKDCLRPAHLVWCLQIQSVLFFLLRLSKHFLRNFVFLGKKKYIKGLVDSVLWLAISKVQS